MSRSPPAMRIHVPRCVTTTLRYCISRVRSRRSAGQCGHRMSSGANGGMPADLGRLDGAPAGCMIRPFPGGRPPRGGTLSRGPRSGRAGRWLPDRQQAYGSPAPTTMRAGYSKGSNTRLRHYEPARTSTATRITSWPPTWPPAPDRDRLPGQSLGETPGIADDRMPPATCKSALAANGAAVLRS
jgi:hypothetical protein